MAVETPDSHSSRQNKNNNNISSKTRKHHTKNRAERNKVADRTPIIVASKTTTQEVPVPLSNSSTSSEAEATSAVAAEARAIITTEGATLEAAITTIK